MATEKQLAARLKAQFAPTILFLDERGDVALRLNGYSTLNVQPFFR